MSKISLACFMALLGGAVLTTFRALWVVFHLCLPILYQLGYKQDIPSPLSRNQVGLYERYMRMGQEWSIQAARLRDHWLTFRDVSMVLLGIAAPYLEATKAPTHSMTFTFGSLCIFDALVGVLVAHAYVGNSQNLHKPVMIDFWLEASNSNSGLWFWTLISLPAVWFIATAISFSTFVFSSVWEDLSRGVPDPLSTRLAFFHRALLLITIATAILHSAMIVIAWVRIRCSPILGS